MILLGALSRDDRAAVDVLCVAVGQIEFEAAPPSSGTFSMLPLPFPLLGRFKDAARLYSAPEL